MVNPGYLNVETSLIFGYFVHGSIGNNVPFTFTCIINFRFHQKPKNLFCLFFFVLFPYKVIMG